MRESIVDGTPNHCSDGSKHDEFAGKMKTTRNESAVECKTTEVQGRLVESVVGLSLSPWNKFMKVYRNGQESSSAVPIQINRQIREWSEILQTLQEAIKVPVKQAFTITGKKLSSVSELDKIHELVVSGDEPYQKVQYGCKENGFNKASRSEKRNIGRPKLRKTERESLARSVILEASSLCDVDPKISLSNPLVKTFSEQDVSSMESGLSSPKLRMRQSHSPRPRPISAYQGNMSTSVERNSPLGNSVSRIPKRIITSPSTNSNNQSPSSQTSIPVFNPRSSKKIVDKEKLPAVIVSTERPSRQDALKREFLPAKRIYVIRHGMKPRKSRRILLNPKTTARSFDQVLNHITESLRPDWGAVRKIYNLKKVEISCVEDFFGDEIIFLACPNDRVGTNDFNLDIEEKKSMDLYGKEKVMLSKQTKLRGLEISRSPNRRPKSSSNSQNTCVSISYPNHPKNIKTEDFPAVVKEKYSVGDIIGDGNFAVVRKCTHLQTRETFALKVIDKSKGKGRDAPPEYEVKILGMVQHPNIIKMFEQYDFNNELYIVLEMIEGGDLFEAIAKATKFSEPESASMTRDIASALSFLHSRRIIHRDIKPENLLVYTKADSQLGIKLGDFGLAQIVNGPLYTVCGTPTYVAPEILAESGYGLTVDIWALGVIVYVLLCGYPPFVSPTGEQEELFELILTADYEFPPEHWDSISYDAKHLISRMIEPDSDLRLSANDVLDHPWLSMDSTDSHAKRYPPEDDFNARVFAAMGLTDIHLPGSSGVGTTNNKASYS